MKGLQTTFFIIFSGILSVQAIRHVHLYAFGFEESILVPYQEFFGMKEEIRLEASTDELLAEYEASKEKIKQLRDSDPTKRLHELRQENAEFFARSDALGTELKQRETKARELRDIWLFSIAGFILIGLGSLLYARGYDWVGISLILPGFQELVWWSAPSFSLGGALQEYDLLLVNKIILTVIAFVLIYTLWLVSRRKWQKLEDKNA